MPSFATVLPPVEGQGVRVEATEDTEFTAVVTAVRADGGFEIRLAEDADARTMKPGGTVKLVVGQPIPTAGVPFEARDELNERVRNVVVENFIEDY